MKSPRFFLLTILGVLLVAFGYAIGQVTGKPGLGLFMALALPATVLAVTAVYVAAIGMAVVVHELGHFLAGRAVGFRFHTLVAGPLGYRMDAGRAVRYRVRPARLMGFVNMVPDTSEDLERRYFRFILGGPIASLLWTAVVLAAWKASGVPLMFDTPDHAPLGLKLASVFVTLTVLCTVLVLPGTLLPYRVKRMGGMPTDMLWLLTLRKGGDEARRLVALMTLYRLLQEGTRARDLPVELIKEAARLRDGSLEEMSAVSVAWAHALSHDPAAAQAAIERHAEILTTLGDRMVDPWRALSRATQASHAVFVRRDAEAAERWLGGIPEGHDPTLAATTAVTRAGLAAQRNDPDRDARLQRAEAAVDDAVRRTTTNWEWERERLAEIRAGWPLAPTSPAGP
jgi:hypothetical protein